MNNIKGRWLFIFLITLLVILLSSFLVIGMSLLVLPRLKTNFQVTIFWITSVLVVVISALANISQLSGYSIRDIFSKKKDVVSQNQNTFNNSKDMFIQTDQEKKYSKIQALVSEIRQKIYSDDIDLPNTLLLCLTLCQQVTLDKDYKVWIKNELNGYESIKNKIISGDEETKKWMVNWASYRHVNIYIKIPVIVPNSYRNMIQNFEVGKVFVLHPIFTIIKQMKEANQNNQQEFIYRLIDLDRNTLKELQNFFIEEHPSMKIPSDISCFVSMVEFVRITNDIRGIIINMLDDVNDKY